MTVLPPTSDEHPRAGLRRWAVVAGVWAAIATFSVIQIYVARAAVGHPPPLGPLLTLEVPVWAFWAAVTIPVVMLARRFPLDRTRVAGSVLLHGTAAIVVAVAWVAFHTLWYQAFNPYPMGGTSVAVWFWEDFRRSFILGFVLYWAVVGVFHAFTNYFRYRERELEASRVKSQLTEARLHALKMQLHPHFLFNALNSVSALVEDHPRDARRMIAELAALLRASLRSDALHVVPLEDEMKFLKRYLDIEQTRFGDRLAVTLDVDPATRRASIPSFLCQPLVENAIRHGIARKESAGHIWLSTRRLNGSLVVDVEDDGPGLTRGRFREGVGLANTRRRLSELYGSDQSLTLRSRKGGGLDVRVEIPFRPSGSGP